MAAIAFLEREFPRVSGAWHVLLCVTDVEIGDTSFSRLESFLIQEGYNPERSGDNGQ